jgi:hypothetical protein
LTAATFTLATAAESKAGWFELIVGKSMPNEGDAECFGFVTSYDTKPKRRLAELLKAQGLQMNQAITFLSDGGDNVRDLQLYLSPLAEHLLDWFHITMRITVLRQQLKELIAAAPEHDLAALDGELERVKWYLWHGNVFRALQVIEEVQWRLEDLDEEVRASRKLAKTVAEFHTYITANEGFIPNYGDRYRYGEIISTAFVESTVKGGDQQAVRQAAADALDQKGRASAAAGANPSVERGPAVNLRALVSGNDPHGRFASTGRVVGAPGLKWSPPSYNNQFWCKSWYDLHCKREPFAQ